MKLTNKVALISASVLTASALLITSPALAHKGGPKATPKPTSSVTATATPTPPTFGGKVDGDGDREHGFKGRGREGKLTPITQSVTVDVPATGSYQLLVTEVKPANAPTPPAGAPTRPDHSFTVPVTGTGSQTLTVNLPHPGNYTVTLVSVVSTQTITAVAPTK